MAETVIINIHQGNLRGKEATSKYGRTYYSFQGIPYAKPPVGHLRFKAPQPADPWEGVRDALTEGAVSPHFDVLHDVYVGEEDCLFLNVYTPRLTDGQDPMAVMVWIHGGGFFFGSGNTDLYGPARLMTGDIVLVTINYRLGALGFLSTGDSVVPGNNGLKDQVMALRWVQQNIAQFGGDPGNVTIFGESAGGASVHFQLLSPTSEGLFHRAIAQSGCALNPWAFEESSVARSKAFKFGEVLGCKTTDSKCLVDFLMHVSERQLVEGANKILTEEEKHPGPKLFVPTNERVTNSGEEIFLPGLPEDLMSQGKFHNVPFILGVTSLEGMFELKDVNTFPSFYESSNQNFEILTSAHLNITKNTEKSRQIAQKIKTFYFNDKPVCKDTWQQLSEFFSDMFFVSGVYRTAKEHQKNSTAPVYLYQFSYDGVLGFTDYWLGNIRLRGASHTDDLGYLFDMFIHDDLKLSPEDESLKISSSLIKMWTNFAKHGNPTPETNNLLEVTWGPVDESIPYLDIDKQLVMKEGLVRRRMDFWDTIYACLNT